MRAGTARQGRWRGDGGMPGQAGASRDAVPGLLACGRGGGRGGRGAAGLGQCAAVGRAARRAARQARLARRRWRRLVVWWWRRARRGPRRLAAPRAAAAGGAGQECPQGGFAAGGGQPEQDGGGDAGAGGQVGVAGEFGGDAVQVLAAGVVLEEKVGHGGPGGGVLGPLAVAVGPGQVTPQRGAPPFGPPARQRGVPGLAALGGEGAEHRVGPGRVGELDRQGDGQGPVAAVAELAGGDAVLGGQQVGAGFVEDEMQRRGPGRRPGAGTGRWRGAGRGQAAGRWRRGWCRTRAG